METKKDFVEKVKAYNQKSRKEFKETMSHLLTHEKVKHLDTIKQHHKCTRLKHSVNVSYYSFYVAKLLGLDYQSAAKAGLLHDLHFNKETKEKIGIKENIKLLRNHPEEALKNAAEICDLNDKEQDAIKRHMWLVTVKPPKYKEGYVVSFVDKYCAAKEFFSSVFSKKFQAKSFARLNRFY